MEKETLLEFTVNELVNLKEIDEQHQKIFEILNQLNVAILEKKGHSLCLNLINNLLSEFDSHFGLEEELMKKNNYKNYYYHKIEHDRCIRKIKEFKIALNDDDIIFAEDFIIYLTGWINNHIESKDKKLADYLNRLDK